MSDDELWDEIPKFNGRNWNAVVSRLNDQLEYKGLKDLIDGIDTQPALPKIDDELSEWERRNARARFLIKAVLRDEDIIHVEGMETAHEVMQKVNDVFHAPGRQKLWTLQTEFYGMKFTGSVDGTASRLTRLQTQIADIDREERPTEGGKEDDIAWMHAGSVSSDGCSDRPDRRSVMEDGTWYAQAERRRDNDQGRRRHRDGSSRCIQSTQDKTQNI